MSTPTCRDFDDNASEVGAVMADFATLVRQLRAEYVAGGIWPADDAPPRNENAAGRRLTSTAQPLKTQHAATANAHSCDPGGAGHGCR